MCCSLAAVLHQCAFSENAVLVRDLCVDDACAVVGLQCNACSACMLCWARNSVCYWLLSPCDGVFCDTEHQNTNFSRLIFISQQSASERGVSSDEGSWAGVRVSI